MSGSIGRDLVVHEDAASGLRDARQLGDRELRPADVVQRAPAAREVERAVLELERRRVPFEEARVGGRILARRREQLGDEVDADDLADERREGECERARARSRVEHALVAAERREELRELLSQRVDLRARVRDERLGVLAEARAHRVVVAHASTTVRRVRRGSEVIRVTSS